MNHRQRMETCLKGDQPDRTPVALWRHFPVDDKKGKTLAAAHLNYQKNFDFDFLKVTPASGYFLYDWGVEDEWRGHPHGTCEYTKRVVHSLNDWTKLPKLDPNKGHLGETISALKTLTKELLKHFISLTVSSRVFATGDSCLFVTSIAIGTLLPIACGTTCCNE